jgi:ubiquinone biosynthesis protein
MLRRWAVLRILAVAVVVALILPQYWLLVWRSRWPALRPTQAAWDRVHRRAAALLHALGVRLAGLFVKLCQIVGARADVFPRPFIERLGRFHDRVPARSFAALRPHLERELGRDAAPVLAAVDPEPIAAASLAQVHRLELPDGRPAVIKLQYPEIARLARIDLASIRRVARIAARLQKRLDLRSIVEEVARFIALELDFTREADSTERVRAAFGDSDDVRIPRVHRSLCSAKVLVLERLEGVRVLDLAELERAGHDRRAVARRIGRIYATMIFEHGFFHGDPHPGNLLVMADGRIGLLDFGLAKELPPGFAAGVARLLVGALGGDGAAVAREARGLGFEIGDDADPEALLALVRQLLGQRGEDESVLDVLGRLRVAKIPDDFGLVVRTLIILNGLSHSLAPGERVIQLEMMRRLSEAASKRS